MLNDLRYRLRAIFRRREMERELADELELHYERETAKLVGRGVPLAEAQRLARLAMGGTQHIKENARDAWGTRWLGAGLRETRYAVRVLLKHPGVSASALVILAMTSGASTAIFSVLDATVFKPLPVANADRLVRLELLPDTSGKTSVFAPYAVLEQLRAARGLEQLAAEGRPLTLASAVQRPGGDAGTGGQAGTANVRAMCATGNYFDVLGLHARVGRTLQPSDEDPSADSHVAVGTYQLWKDRYQLDPNAIGSTIRVLGAPFTLVGFLPEGFQGIRKATTVDVYIPMAAMSDACARPWGGGNGSVQAIGLVARGTTRAAAAAEFAVFWNRLRESPEFPTGAIGGQLALTDASHGIASVDRAQETSLYLLASGVALVLVIGCLNASCLLVVQGVARRNEIAIRRALGASARAILTQSLIESGLLALVGGLCGIALATLGEKAILMWLRWGVRPIDLSLDGRVLGFSLAVVVIAAVVSGLLPALEALRTHHLEIYRDEHLRPFRSGKALIVVEVALSLVLVAGAGMFLRGVANLRSVPLGFSARDVVVLSLWPKLEQFPQGRNDQGYMTTEALRLHARLLQIPGMDRSTVGPGRTFTGGISSRIARADSEAESVPMVVQHVDDRYFDVLQMPLLFGRVFSAHDDDSGERVAILNRSLAERLFTETSPLGQQVTIGTTITRVVGVVGDIHQKTLKDSPASLVYLPLWQRPIGTGWTGQVDVQVRTRRSPADVAAVVEGELDSGRYALQLSTLAQPTSLETTIGASYEDDTIRMGAMSLLAGIALVLVLAGIFGLMSYVVARRSREIGVRMAIGASPNRIVRLILNDCVRLVVIGILLGIPGALLVMRALSSVTFHVTPLDPLTLVGAVVVMLLTAGVATFRPLWQSTRVDPVETLRAI